MKKLRLVIFRSFVIRQKMSLFWSLKYISQKCTFFGPRPIPGPQSDTAPYSTLTIAMNCLPQPVFPVSFSGLYSPVSILAGAGDLPQSPVSGPGAGLVAILRQTAMFLSLVLISLLWHQMSDAASLSNKVTRYFSTFLFPGQSV